MATPMATKKGPYIPGLELSLAPLTEPVAALLLMKLDGMVALMAYLSPSVAAFSFFFAFFFFLFQLEECQGDLVCYINRDESNPPEAAGALVYHLVAAKP